MRLTTLASHSLSAALAVSLALSGCSKPNKNVAAKKKTSPALSLNDKATKNEADIKNLQTQIAQKSETMTALEKRVADIEARLHAALNTQNANAEEIARLKNELATAKAKLGTLETNVAQLHAELIALRTYTDGIESRMLEKLSASSLGAINKRILEQNMGKDWTINSLEGTYNVLLIPVEFANKQFDNRDFIENDAQEYLFGRDHGSLSTYYRHVSGGRLQVSGTVTPIVTVDKPLEFYGAAVTNTEHDKDARQLVVDALKSVMADHQSNPSWWNQFDQWDLNDYDGDKVYRERDGLIDAVVLIYAGKEQSSCAGYFPFESTLDPTNPQYASAVECNNRIWPHRSAIFLADGSPDKPTTGPSIENSPVMAQVPLGIKITPSVHAFDYNMQSEYSDRSTFIHEFGHSLTFPDVYAVNSSFDNGSAYWTAMSSNAKDGAQEIGPLERMMVGWLTPRIVRQGENTSAYLGNVAFVDAERRDGLRVGSDGLDFIRRAMGWSDTTSIVPGTDEPVYRALMAIPNPYHEKVTVTAMPVATGNRAAYSNHRDDASISIKFNAQVPADAAAQFSFDTLWAVETETNFSAFSAENSDVKVLTNYDVGMIFINDQLVETLQTVSGDTNGDSLADMNPECKAADVLALRLKYIAGTVSADEKKQFASMYKICKQPTWIRKSFDLSNVNGQDMRGQNVNVEIRYVTDGGAGELGLIVDNVRLGEETFDFESGNPVTGDFMLLSNGAYDATYNHFYLLERRDPTTDFGGASLNMDQNIEISVGFFMPPAEGATPRDRFRIVDVQYQPGVMAWYFNPKFDRRGNTPVEEKNDGEGYYLPISSKVRELPMPGSLGDASLFNESGEYAATTDTFKAEAEKQRAEFICFGYTAYAKYLFGKDPDCSNFDQNYLNDLLNLRHDGKKLIFNFVGINEILPKDRVSYHLVARPFSGMYNGATYLRQALVPFRTPSSGPAKPFRVWKVAPGTTDLVLDEQLTNAQATYAPSSVYSDADNTKTKAWWHRHPRFLADSPMVHETGFGFFVADPDSAVTGRFQGTNPAAPDFVERRPVSKVYLFW